MTHEIFKSIQHQRVTAENDIFDLYQCGLFNAENIELVELQPKAKYRQHYHKNSTAIIYVIAGFGRFLLADELMEYEPGIKINIPAGMLHGFKTKTRTLFLSIQSPPIINPDNGEIDLHYD